METNKIQILQLSQQGHRRPLLFRLTNRVTIFLTLLSGSLILFYITGNYQQFLDSDQHLILSCCAVSGIGLSLFSFFSFAESVYYLLVTGEKIRWIFMLHAITLFFICFGAVAMTLAIRAIIFLSAGIPE